MSIDEIYNTFLLSSCRLEVLFDLAEDAANVPCFSIFSVATVPLGILRLESCRLRDNPSNRAPNSHGIVKNDSCARNTGTSVEASGCDKAAL